MADAEQCYFCGECAVMEEDIDGRYQRICVECGSVQPCKGRPIPLPVSEQVGGQSRGNDCKPLHHACLSCGEDLSSGKLSKCGLCDECCHMEEMEDHAGISVVATLLPEEDVKPVKCGRKEQACTACQSQNLDYDLVGCDERLVCQDCGMVLSGVTFSSGFSESMISENTKALTSSRHGSKKKNLGFLKGTDKITVICEALSFPSDTKAAALEMFKKAFFTPEIVNRSLLMKEHVGATCLLLVCRQQDIPVNTVHFKPHLDEFRFFSRAKKLVAKALKMDLPATTIMKQVAFSLDHRGFGLRMVTKVRDLLFLLRKAWCTQGKNREGVITVASYYAYISSDQCTKFMSMSKFKKQFKFQVLSKKVKAQCCGFLMKLALALPWVQKEKVTGSTLHFFINDILDYRASLMYLAFESCGRGLSSDLGAYVESSPSHSSKSSPNTVLTKKENPLAFALNKTEITADNPDDSKSLILNIADKNGSGIQDNHSGYLPRHSIRFSLKRPLKPEEEVTQEDFPSPNKVKSEVQNYSPNICKAGRQEYIDLDSIDINSDEFDDTEMNSYILSEEEQKNIPQVKLDIVHGKFPH